MKAYINTTPSLRKGTHCIACSIVLGWLLASSVFAETFTFNATVDSDFLNAANWSGDSGGTATPANMAAADTYVVANAATLSGSAALNGDLTVNAGITLTVAVGGTLTLNGGSDLTISNTGLVSVEGAMVMNNAGTQANPTTISGSSGANQGLRIETTGSFTRSSSGHYSTIGVRVTNHGTFTESVFVGTPDDFWEGISFTNSASGTAVLRSGSKDRSVNIDNAGIFTASRPLDDSFEGGKDGSVNITNSGTFHAPSGLTLLPTTAGMFTNQLGGIFNIGGRLGGLRNHGTVNLTGNVIPGNPSGNHTQVEPIDNFASGVVNQGTFSFIVDNRTLTNAGTWNSSGELILRNGADLTISTGGVVDNDGSWSFPTAETDTQINIAGTLSGTATMNVPAAASLTLTGGNLASPVVSSTDIHVTANSTISGSLTVAGTDMGINPGITLTVAVGGTLTLNGGSDLTISNTGLVSVEGAMVMNNAETELNPTTIVGSTAVNQGLRIETTGSFTRTSSGNYSSIKVHVTNHGTFTETFGGPDVFWEGISFVNSASGTAILRSGSDRIVSIDNAGIFTANKSLDDSFSTSTANEVNITNSGTFHAPNGVHVFTEGTVTNQSGGV